MKWVNEETRCGTLSSNCQEHWGKYRNITQVPGAQVLSKGTFFAQFWANSPKLCGKCAFPQNFHTRKVGEITLFFAVEKIKSFDY